MDPDNRDMMYRVLFHAGLWAFAVAVCMGAYWGLIKFVKWAWQ